MSVSSDDDSDRRSQRFLGYRLSADVSGSDSSSIPGSAFSCGRRQASSSTLDFDSKSESSPLVVLPPVVAGRHVTVPTVKPEKCETELPGELCIHLVSVLFV